MSNVEMTSLGIAYAVLYLTSFQCAFALSCYQCGIGTDKQDSCEILPRINNFIVDCHATDFCSKSTSRGWESDTIKEETTRGCATRVTINGKHHELGCHTDQRTGAEICYCDTNLCNGVSSSRFEVSNKLLTAAVLIAVQVIAITS